MPLRLPCLRINVRQSKAVVCSLCYFSPNNSTIAPLVTMAVRYMGYICIIRSTGRSKCVLVSRWGAFHTLWQTRKKKERNTIPCGKSYVLVLCGRVTYFLANITYFVVKNHISVAKSTHFVASIISCVATPTNFVSNTT